MPLIDELLAIGPIRKTIWRWWYPFLSRRLRQHDVLFLNYAFETDPPMGLPLSRLDETNRACSQLYHHVAGQADLRGKDVLEVSCGHGGGASYVARTFGPRKYTGLDLNPTGIRFCRERHKTDALRFVQGDAERLPFPDSSFDAVINVEASHCYPRFDQFLGEVARVLRPEGVFLYADFRFNAGLAEWDAQLADAPLTLVASRVINAEVVRGMDLNAAASEKLIVQHLPPFLHRLGRDFAGIPGSRVYNAVKGGELSYRSYHFVRTDSR